MSLAPEHPAPPALPEVPEGVTPAPARPVWHPGVALAAFVGAFLVAGMFGAVFFVASGDSDDPPAWANIGATILQDVVLIGVAVGAAALVARPAAWQFGLRRVRAFWPAVGWTVLGYVTFIAFSAAFLSAIGADAEDDLPQDLGADESTAALLGIAFLVTVGAPLAEEFFFRGYLYRAFRTWRGPIVGALVVGVLFGLVHAGGSDPAFLLPLGVLGVIFCLLYEKTGSLYPCIVLHTVNNSIAFGASMDWDWQIPVALASALAINGAIVASVRRLGGAPPPLAAT